LNKLRVRCRREAFARSRDIHRLVAFVTTEDQLVEILGLGV
jgi:hypothetical protein